MSEKTEVNQNKGAINNSLIWISEEKHINDKQFKTECN